MRGTSGTPLCQVTKFYENWSFSPVIRASGQTTFASLKSDPACAVAEIRQGAAQQSLRVVRAGQSAARSSLPMDARLETINAAEPTLDTDRVRDIVLVRIATAGKTLIRADLTRELQPLASHLVSPAAWAAIIDRDLAALADAGLVSIKPLGVNVTEPGMKRAALVLGLPVLPRTWSDAKGGRLMVKALGLDNLPARRMKALLESRRSAQRHRAQGLQHQNARAPHPRAHPCRVGAHRSAPCLRQLRAT